LRNKTAFASFTSALIKTLEAFSIISSWLDKKGWKPFAFQEETWQHILNDKSGLVNAPTGCGKTYSVFVGALIKFIH